MRPATAPLTFTDFPATGFTARVDFGALPDEVVDAERGRRAIGRMMLTSGVFGGESPAGTPDERFEEAIGSIDPADLFGEYKWYVTIVVEKQIEQPDDEVAALAFASSRSMFEIADEAVAETRDALDLLAAIASAVVSERAFATVVLEDRVHLLAAGRAPAGVPVMEAGAVGISMTSTLERIEGRVRVLAELDPRQAAREEWLARAAHWRMQTLREADPWKRYQWAFVGLEILIHKLYARVRDDVASRLRLELPDGDFEAGLPIADLLWTPERAPLTARFAVAATALFPESALEDVQTFRTVKEARDRLSHGSLRSEDELPIASVVGLFGKYVEGAVKQFVFGRAPTTDWEA
jgi:hypothetical protein